jgi:hypothetical protein
MILKDWKHTITDLIEEDTDLDANAVFAEAQMTMLDLDIEGFASGTDWFCLGYAIGAYKNRYSGGTDLPEWSGEPDPRFQPGVTR